MQLDQFLDNLRISLPEVCDSRQLVSACPEIFKNTVYLHRLRIKSLGPAYIRLPTNSYRYLKEDVLAWLHNLYKSQNHEEINV